MTTEKKCPACGLVSREEDLEEHVELERFPEGERMVTERLIYQACPSCGSEDLADFQRCAGCNNAEALEGHDYCRECLGILEAGS